jgi:hypothetical protein
MSSSTDRTGSRPRKRRTSPRSPAKYAPEAPHQCVEPLADAELAAAIEVEPGEWPASNDPDSPLETLRCPALTL